MTHTVRQPIAWPSQPYLDDHRFQNRPVLPAVEAVEILARAVKEYQTATDVTAIGRQQFDRFLYLDPAVGNTQGAFCEITIDENRDVHAALMTRLTSKAAGLSRLQTHAAVSFPQENPASCHCGLDVASALEGACFSVPKEKVYGDLVPFGPSFQNVDTLHLTPEGAIAEIRAPHEQAPAGRPWLLGSPFVLDAAFHAACVWGQRFAATVAFPVGIDCRRVYEPAQPGEVFFARVLPQRTTQSLLTFDLRIYDSAGRLREAADGVRMRDVSGGTLKPPGWIDAGKGRPAASRIAARCKAASVIDMRGVAPFADQVLSVEERERYDKMGDRRRKSFLAGRLACKRISRQLSGNDLVTDARSINTVAADSPGPRCPSTDGGSAVSCSMAHDSRFAVAVAAENRVGVDVEEVAARVMRSRRLYMNPTEITLADRTALVDKIGAAVRIWTIKEAVTKALDIPLPDAWHRVAVERIGPHESQFRIDDDCPQVASHELIEKHIVTIVLLK
jgi:phosphopantetheinyl transferase